MKFLQRDLFDQISCCAHQNPADLISHRQSPFSDINSPTSNNQLHSASAPKWGAAIGVGARLVNIQKRARAVMPRLLCSFICENAKCRTIGRRRQRRMQLELQRGIPDKGPVTTTPTNQPTNHHLPICEPTYYIVCSLSLFLCSSEPLHLTFHITRRAFNFFPTAQTENHFFFSYAE